MSKTIYLHIGEKITIKHIPKGMQKTDKVWRETYSRGDVISYGEPPASPEPVPSAMLKIAVIGDKNES